MRKDIPGFPGYQVDEEGVVYGKRGKRAPMRPHFPADDYPWVGLYDESGKQRTKKLHTIVMLAFRGPKPDGMEIRHLDGDKTNYRLSNLVYGTRSENNADRARHGWVKRDLTKEQVFLVRLMIDAKAPIHRTAKFLGINRTTVSDIARGISYRDVV